MRNRIIPICAVFLSLLTVVLRGEGQIPEPPRKLKSGEVYIKVPKCIMEDLFDKASRFILAIYPDADKKVINELCRSKQANKFHIIGTGGNIGNLPRWEVNENPMIGSSDKPKVVLTFPDGKRISLDNRKRLAGVKNRKEEMPLSDNAAKKIALDTAKRIFQTNLGATKPFILKNSGYAQSFKSYYFHFRENRKIPYHKAGSSFSTYIRKTDGLIIEARLSEHYTPPEKPLKDILEQAKKGIPQYKAKLFSLRKTFFLCKPRLKWTYVQTGVSREPGGIVEETEHYRTEWDAETGKLLYSEVLNGGTRIKPFRAEKYDEMLDEDDLEEEFKRKLPEIKLNLKKLMDNQEKMLSGGNRNKIICYISGLIGIIGILVIYWVYRKKYNQ